MIWNKILCNHRELQLIGTLNGGQSFRWTHNKETDEWIGVFCKTVWKLRQHDDYLQYQVLGSLLNKTSKIGSKRKNVDIDCNIFKKSLEEYLRLDVNLGDYYTKWSESDELFKSACQQFYGIRMLKQEPVENIFSFICSQNNHISRISSMVEKLCVHYGEEICEHEGITYYAFPEVNKLMHFTIESELRGLGFGYRAKFIQKSAQQIQEWGALDWLNGLQDMKYKDAKQELMKLHGIGPKVADCICLMSLNHLEALPVDTHVYQIAAQNYLPHLRGKKSVTDKMYAEIGDHFRKLYGDMAGWAHTIESELRGLGFGYRAKFIQKSAQQIQEWGALDWLNGLQDMKYKDAKQELMKLHGIGPKVADCICLMSLNHLEALPVDTHVYQIAAQNYLPHLRGKKSVTDKMYAEIGDHFRKLYGDMAGWAHTVLFCADLKKFHTMENREETNVDNSKPKKKKRKS